MIEDLSGNPSLKNSEKFLSFDIKSCRTVFNQTRFFVKVRLKPQL